MKYPAALQNLIEEFSKLPTVGPKTAERYVFYLLKQDPEQLQKFAQAIAELKEKIIICKYCGSITETNPCHICSDTKRNHQLICVVSNMRDLIALESANVINGVYHILGGVISLIDEIAPQQLSIKKLEQRIKDEKVKEIILALNPNMEGEATALYLAKHFKTLGIKITRLAKGLPMGAELEYADEITLNNAVKFRNEI
jgi:recombination protein RecR